LNLGQFLQFLFVIRNQERTVSSRNDVDDAFLKKHSVELRADRTMLFHF
jgi:hypothetical protein